MKIEYGNLSGKYFSKSHIKELEYLAEEISMKDYHMYMEGVDSCKIWYDAHEDFHKIEFTYMGYKIMIRYYKVFGYSINGEWHGTVVSTNYLKSEINRILKIEEAKKNKELINA